MGDVVDFKKKKPAPYMTDHMFTLNVYMNTNGEYEVDMQMEDAYADADVLEAMVAVMMKFAMDQELVDGDKFVLAEEPETIH